MSKTLLGTNSFYVLMCRKAVIQSINHGEIDCWLSAETLQGGQLLNVHIRAQSAACRYRRRHH